jgi:hypothetical protein
MTHDPVSEFGYAMALVLIFNVRIPIGAKVFGLPIVPWTIRLYWWLSAPGIPVSRVAASAGVGIIEQTLYIYCLSSTHREFIGSVLLFKAFFTWLSMAPQAVPQTDGAGAAAPKPVVARHDLLEIFYTYAIGNFLSLAFAIFFYEIVHLWLIRIIPWRPLYFLHS